MTIKWIIISANRAREYFGWQIIAGDSSGLSFSKKNLKKILNPLESGFFFTVNKKRSTYDDTSIS